MVLFAADWWRVTSLVGGGGMTLVEGRDPGKGDGFTQEWVSFCTMQKRRMDISDTKKHDWVQGEGDEEKRVDDGEGEKGNENGVELAD